MAGNQLIRENLDCRPLGLSCAIKYSQASVQSTLGVGGCGNICFCHVLVAVRQGQRREAVTTGEEQPGIFAARKSKYIRLYLYNGKLILATTYLRRAYADCRNLWARLAKI
jgi:hypothetical protein